MQAILNELSIPVGTKEAEALLDEMLTLLKKLQDINSQLETDQFALRISTEAKGLLEKNILDQIQDREKLATFKSLIRTPVIKKEGESKFFKYKQSNKNIKVIGLYISYINSEKDICVSFNSPEWKKSFISIIQEIIKKNTLEEKEMKVIHASEKSHCLDHEDWFKKQFNWSKWNKEIKKDRGKVGKVKEIGRKIAKINGWEYSKKITKKNRRDVYQTKDLYLGVDTQEIEFEVHKNAGGNNHLGSISFDRKRKKPKNNNRKLNCK